MSARAAILNSLKFVCLLVTTFTLLAQQTSAQNVERGQWEDILKLVAADVQKNFYDPGMKGLDWVALTQETSQRIRISSNTGQMILAISSLLSRLQDSHTYFIPPRLTAHADFGFKASAYGNDVRVYDIAKKGPADKAGLRVGDAITSLNGVPVDRGNISEVLRLVTTVVPAAALDLDLASLGAEHRRVHIPAHMITTQEHQYVEDVFRVADEQRARDIHVNFSHKEYDNGVYYVRIPSFTAAPETTYSEINRAKQARVLVLDLRGNGGGWETTLTTFLGFFTGQPSVVGKKVSRSQSQDLTTKLAGSGFSGSVIVLVDSETASAAEVVARYLQVSNKAVVIGDLTSGKVNQGHLIAGKIGARFVLPFAVSVTTAKLVMTNGEELEGRGVTPDVRCVPSQEDLLKELSPCLDQALDLAKKPQSSAP